MAELMSLIALVSMLAAVVAGWYLWRAVAWHPHGGMPQPRTSAATGPTWSMPGSSAGRPTGAPTGAAGPSRLTGASAVGGTDTGAGPVPLQRRPRTEHCNRHVNAGRWSTDRHGDGDPSATRGAGFTVPGFSGGRRGGGGSGGGGGGIGRGGGADDRGDPAATREELRLAVRAVLVHTPQQWPGGTYCSNDRSPFPCRMRHWGEQVLLAAGWDAESIEAMARQADAGLPPWLAGAGEATPPQR
jgi:hypothetical protein